jgi:hypothetical protein
MLAAFEPERLSRVFTVSLPAGTRTRRHVVVIASKSCSGLLFALMMTRDIKRRLTAWEDSWTIDLPLR